MAKLVNKPQAIRAGVRNPAPGYSRVVGVHASQAADPPWLFGYSMPVGNDFRVLSARLWWFATYAGPITQFEVKLYVGRGEPANESQLENWTDIMPICWGLGKTAWWKCYGTGGSREWPMTRLFTGETLRLGVRLRAADVGDHILVDTAFQISEG